MDIKAVLFDADGVLQRPSLGSRQRWEQVLGSSQGVDAFLVDVFTAEEPALTGKVAFVDALTAVLSGWRCRGTIQDALDAWTMIDVDPDVATTIGLLRRLGVACHLATNQEPHRARHMSGVLGYNTLFDREFYSCQIGVAKPDLDYFATILRDIGADPGAVLFIDDHQSNIDGARKLGLNATEFNVESGVAVLYRLLGAFGVHVA